MDKREIRKTMQLLQIEDVTTKRQLNNGTVVWRLPIKCGKDKFIEVASFKTGYVRNQNSGYSNYQLNKRIFVDDYYPEFTSEQGHCVRTNKYIKYKTKSCVLIPNEIDRLEYLIAYCLKNYYIKNANQVAEGSYVSKWYHEWELEKANETYSENTGAMERIGDLENKLATIQRIADHG